jgi:hypothetical protein
VSREGIEPSSVAYRATALDRCASETCRRGRQNRTDHERFVGPPSPPGELSSMSRGSEDRTHDLLLPKQARYHFATPRSIRRERRDRTDRLLHMKQPSPPGDLLAKVAGRQGIEPCTRRFGVRTEPQLVATYCDSGTIRTPIAKFVASHPIF